jgi:acyl-coenzyme A synthetase/AMP-(fatty) acid ligase
MLLERIYEWARSRPKKTAIIDNDVPINYASFSRAIDAARRFLEPHALPAGRTAIVLFKSPLEGWILLLALRSLGLNTICVETIEIAERLKLRDVAFLVVAQSELNSHDLRAQTLTGTQVIVVPTTIYASVHTGEVPAIRLNNPPFGGHIIFTSGTTSGHKKLVLDSTFEDRRNETRARIYSFSKDTITNEVSGLSNGTGAKSAPAVWHVGGCVVYDWRPDHFSRMFRHGVNSLKVPPFVLRKLVRSVRTSGPMNHDCELIIGAGFLSVSLAEEAISRVARRLMITYGSSEMGATLLLSRFTATHDMHWLAPGDGRTIQIVDERGNECPEGELRIPLTDIDCTSYLDDQEASAKVFRNGFFYPGDMAVRRADGRIRILGRVDDMVNVRGQKIAVAPIEHEIQQLLGVDEVCLFCGLNAAGNEELAVAIQSSRQLSRSEVEAVACRWPSERVRVTVFNEFPRTETGSRKTRRSVLKKLVFGETPLFTSR